MLTERQAWLYLAKRWDKVKRDEHGEFVVLNLRDTASGLCSSIRCLLRHYRIGAFTFTAMMRRVEAEDKRRKIGGGYIWPRTAAGAKRRAAFCRRMAEACVKKRKRVATAKGGAK